MSAHPPPTSRTPGTRVVALALVSWLIAALILTGSAIARESLSEELAAAPAVGDVAFALGLALVAIQALVLTGAPRRPGPALVGVAALAPVGGLIGLGPAIGCTSVAVIVGAFLTVAPTRTSPRTSPTGAGIALAGAALLVAAGELVVQARADAPLAPALATALLQGAGAVGVPAAVGFLVASRRETRAALAERTRAAAGERAALVEVAVARERTAMARELHDIAAHHLTGIVVMSGAISRQIDQDPAGAKQAVDQVREQSRSMLRDMRGLVGLLRSEPGVDGASEGALPQESFDGIAGLVASAARRGEPVDLSVLGPSAQDPRDRIGPLAQLSAYRTVQEALTNAARHAPGASCRVVLDVGSPQRVVVSVTNAVTTTATDAPAPVGPLGSSGGFGLVGMKERAELTDSRLTVGPTEGGGWQVTLTIPVRDDPRLTTEPTTHPLIKDAE